MGKDLKIVNQTFFFCDGGSCQKAGSEQVIRHARAHLMNRGFWKNTHTIKTRCNGRCENAPTCIVDGTYWYQKLTPDNIIPILESHINKGEPIVQDLLFQKGWDKIASDKNMTLGQAKTFELQDDLELGSSYIAKGFSSDQYLFPLFTFLFEEKESFLSLADNARDYPFKNGKVVSYANSNKMSLIFKDGVSIDLIIGSVTKETTQKDLLKKVAKTEYYVQSATGNRGIRFKNKTGGTIGAIPLEEKHQRIWDYCLEIQLNNAKDPSVHKLHV